MSRLMLQRILCPPRVEIEGLYWRSSSVRGEGVLLEADRLDLDTYFNSFDESIWLRHTRIGDLAAEVTLTGYAEVQLWRHSRASGSLKLSRATARPGESLILQVPSPPHPRAAGRLCLLIVAEEDGTRLKLGGWTARVTQRDVALMPVICTFNRDRPLVALLDRIVSDEQACNALAGIVVVNQGPPGLDKRLGLPAIRLGKRLHIVEQQNLGGAGGFTRGLMAARDLGASHAVLMDDDVEIEPEALLRSERFFALSRKDVLLAGHMLDLFRPNHLYEGGAQLDDARLALLPQHHGADLAAPGSLYRFLEPTPMHYNGWWFLGVPLSLLDRHGWPMPCFIRGDDVEFGRRLHDAGVAHVSMAGIGIWHEPFYAKLGSWHLYYEFRNMLVLSACGLSGSPRAASHIAIKWVLADLLAFRYQRAALLMRATGDFLDGPEIFTRNPREVHASLDVIRRRYPPEFLARERVAAWQPVSIGPKSRLAFAARLAAALVYEWFRPDGAGAVIGIEPADHVWFRMRRAEAVAVNEGWEIDQPLYRRSRKSFRTLAATLCRLVLRMRSEMPAAFAAWRSDHSQFTSEQAWRNYFARHGQPQGAIATMKAPALFEAGVAS